HFARQLLFGEPAPFDIYNAADVTIPGILAYRSAQEDGAPIDVPNFRKKADRDAYRRDDVGQARYDLDGMFPKRADKTKTKHFDRVIRDLLHHAGTVRAFADWSKVFGEAQDKAAIVGMADTLIESYPDIRSTMRKARRLADLYPRSDGARVLKDVLALAGEEAVLRRGFLDETMKLRTRMKRRLKR
ncbi:MAG: hypothetical protein GY851_13115, partial [bacterium]|nr:hypothetical protein [bacterium]